MEHDQLLVSTDTLRELMEKLVTCSRFIRSVVSTSSSRPST
jgi:hypothetical protein